MSGYVVFYTGVGHLFGLTWYWNGSEGGKVVKMTFNVEAMIFMNPQLFSGLV